MVKSHSRCAKSSKKSGKAPQPKPKSSSLRLFGTLHFPHKMPSFSPAGTFWALSENLGTNTRNNPSPGPKRPAQPYALSQLKGFWVGSTRAPHSPGITLKSRPRFFDSVPGGRCSRSAELPLPQPTPGSKGTSSPCTPPVPPRSHSLNPSQGSRPSNVPSRWGPIPGSRCPRAAPANTSPHWPPLAAHNAPGKPQKSFVVVWKSHRGPKIRPHWGFSARVHCQAGGSHFGCL
ncbi:verprolin-like, partial [Penaeus monodon]|uniref:verprolin-like n=1 Tax=Penaeus monodon TaxID=6687 RepID=UPI0018A7833A